MPIVTLNDTKESNDDDERQAYYAGGQGQNGKGSHGSNMRDFGVRVESSSQIRPHRGLFRVEIENDSHLR